MNRKAIVLLISALGLIILLILGVKWIRQSQPVNKCLDCGGKWNYELKKCERSYNLDSVNIADFYWHTDFDTILSKEYLVRGKMLDSISKSPDYLIEILNKREPKCKIESLGLLGDTLKIRILDDEYLTEQMGSCGASCFLGETIYTLTENDQIKYIRMVMNPGSHAGPGLYCRKGFQQVTEE